MKVHVLHNANDGIVGVYQVWNEATDAAAASVGRKGDQVLWSHETPMKTDGWEERWASMLTDVWWVIERYEMKATLTIYVAGSSDPPDASASVRVRA